MAKMVWDNAQQKMIPLTSKKGTKKVVRVGVDASLAERLKGFAKEDGYSFEGVKYLTKTAKGADGKMHTQKDSKTGKPLFQMEKGKDGKEHIKTEKVAVSVGKVNSALADYVRVAIGMLVESRKATKKA